MKEQALILLQEKRYFELREMLAGMNPVDIAALISELPEETLPRVFRILPKELAAETFVEMDGDEQEILIQSFSDVELREVLDEMYLDDTVDMIEEMPANVVKRILKNTDPELRRTINEVLNYPEDSAGSIMTIEYVDLKRDMTVEDAFKRIRRTGVDKETIYTCYVTDLDRKLLGVISVKTLLLSDYEDIIGDIMDENYIAASTLDDKEDVAHMFSKYALLALPVTDGENRLVGIVTVDDAIDVIEEEATEDIVKMGGITPTEDTYFKTPVWVHAKNRFVWLLLLMVSATFTGMIITRYEAAFAALPLLVALLPMVMDTSGNCGQQSSTMIIRGMALEEIHLSEYFRVLSRELLTALMVGVGLAAVNVARVVLMYGDWRLALISSGTLLCTVLLSKTLGCSLPMLAKRLKLDPALMAAPLITTIVDCCAVFIYFAIASAALGIVM